MVLEIGKCDSISSIRVCNPDVAVLAAIVLPPSVKLISLPLSWNYSMAAKTCTSGIVANVVA